MHRWAEPTAGFSCVGRTSPVRPLSGGLLGSDGSWRTVLAVRLEGRDGRCERRKGNRGGQTRLPKGRDRTDHGRHAAAARAEVAGGWVLARGRIVVGRIPAGVMVHSGVVCMHLVVCLHIVVPVLSDDCRRTRSLTFRAQHRRRHRAQDGEQDGQLDQDEDAEVFHVGRLSSRWSGRAGQQTFHAHGLVSYPATRRLARGVTRLVRAAALDTAASPAWLSRMGHSGRSSP